MSTSSDEVAILVGNIRDLQSKIEKDQKELNQLKVLNLSKSVFYSYFQGESNFRGKREDSL